MTKKMHDVRVVSFIWGKIRTAARETAPQRALRNCSREVVGGRSTYILVKEELTAIACLLYNRFYASHEELMSP